MASGHNGDEERVMGLEFEDEVPWDLVGGAISGLIIDWGSLRWWSRQRIRRRWRRIVGAKLDGLTEKTRWRKLMDAGFVIGYCSSNGMKMLSLSDGSFGGEMALVSRWVIS